MLPEKLVKALNKQIVNELLASNSYLGVASYMDGEDLKVLSGFFFNQSEEERSHALRILKFLLEIGERVEVGAIPAVTASYSSAIDAVEKSLAQEERTTKQINELMSMAKKMDEHAAVSFLKWFVDEQVEEEASMKELLGLVKRAGEQHLLLVEDRLLKRGISIPTPPITEQS